MHLYGIKSGKRKKKTTPSSAPQITEPKSGRRHQNGELYMAPQHSDIDVVQGSSLTENILSVMIHRLCVSNGEIDYMWMLAHFIGLLMSIFVCMYVGVCVVACVFVCVCVEYIAGGVCSIASLNRRG